MTDGPRSDDEVLRFHHDGFLLVEDLLDREEVGLLLEAVQKDQRLQKAAVETNDKRGRSTNLSLWNHPGNDIYGMVARSERVVSSMEQFLGAEVYHYHSKLSSKEPRVGGAWEWHQDYGYWYQNGCLFPDMASIYIALDPATRENGCLEVLRGSHRLGRIEHGRFGEQTGADPERVDAARQRLDHVHCEMDAGAGLFFHANLLHTSSANLSDSPRRGLICCYNTARNDPYREHHHPGYTPLEKVPDGAIRAIGAQGSETSQRFLRPQDDHTSGARSRH